MNKRDEKKKSNLRREKKSKANQRLSSVLLFDFDKFYTQLLSLEKDCKIALSFFHQRKSCQGRERERFD